LSEWQSWLLGEKGQRGQKALLMAGDKGIYNESSEKIIKEKLRDFNLVGWKEDRLSFSNTPLSEIGSILNRYFEVNVVVLPSMGQCEFTGDFKKPGWMKYLM